MAGTDSSAHATTPIELPTMVRNPARAPPISELRTIIAKPAPGVSESSAATGTKAQAKGPSLAGDRTAVSRGGPVG